MNLLSNWKWIIGGIVGLIIAFAVWGSYRYQKGRESVYIELATQKPGIDTVWRKQTVPGASVTKWMAAKYILEVPDSTKAKLSQLTNDIDSLKAVIADKAKPFASEIDSARYHLFILTHPWERVNKVKLDLKSFEIDRPEIIKTLYVTKEPPWWHIPVAIIGGGLIVYAVSRK